MIDNEKNCCIINFNKKQRRFLEIRSAYFFSRLTLIKR